MQLNFNLTDKYAFLRLEKRLKDGNVLSSHSIYPEVSVKFHVIVKTSELQISCREYVVCDIPILQFMPFHSVDGLLV
jgi:hypothetical protein